MALVCCLVILLGDSAVRGAAVGHLRPLLDREQSMETIRAMKTQYHFFQMSWDRAGRDTGGGEILSLVPRLAGEAQGTAGSAETSLHPF